MIVRTTFADDDDVGFTGRLGDLLALVAPRLVVVLDAVRALGLQAEDVLTRIVQPVDMGIDAGRTGAIDDFAGRIGPRLQDQSGTLHLSGCKDVLRRIGRVEHGGHAQRQMGTGRPVLLRRDAVLSLGAVRIGIDEARGDHMP